MPVTPVGCDSLVSIIVAVRDGMPWIRECIASVRAQTHPFIELIVIDDGSVDGTSSYLSTLDTSQFRYIKQANHGTSHARNVGLDVAKGEFVIFLDADDWLTPTCVSDAVMKMQKHKLDVACGGLIRVRDAREASGFSLMNDDSVKIYSGERLNQYRQSIIGFYAPNSPELDTLNFFTVGVGGQVYRRSVIYENRFDIGVKSGEDSLFNLKVSLGVSRFGLTQSTWYYYRLNPDSATKKADHTALETNKLFIERLEDLTNPLPGLKAAVHARVAIMMYSSARLVLRAEKLRGASWIGAALGVSRRILSDAQWSGWMEQSDWHWGGYGLRLRIFSWAYHRKLMFLMVPMLLARLSVD